MSVGMIAAVALGYWQAWRLVIPAVLGLGLVPVLAVVSHRERGPLLLRGDGVGLGDGSHYEFGSAAVDFEVLSNGVPAIRLTRDGESSRARRLMHRPYNLDFNTLLSTIDQLQTWHAQARPTTPAEINAMLTVVQPNDVPIGASVRLDVLVHAGMDDPGSA
ncbi:hypothetical protein ACWDTI_05000 [Gordonia sp. NPDC003424]